MARLSLGRCLLVCWVMMAQATFQAKAVRVLFGGKHFGRGGLARGARVARGGRVAQAQEAQAVQAQEGLFEMERAGREALWEALERTSVPAAQAV